MTHVIMIDINGLIERACGALLHVCYITIKTLTIAISDITLDSCVYRDKKPTIITLNMFLITKSISIHKLGAEKLICTRYFHILLEFNCCGVGIEVFIRVSINYSNPMEIGIFPHQDVRC